MTVHTEKGIACLCILWGSWLLFAVPWMLPLASLCQVSEQDDESLTQSWCLHLKQDAANSCEKQKQGMVKRNKGYVWKKLQAKKIAISQFNDSQVIWKFLTKSPPLLLAVTEPLLSSGVSGSLWYHSRRCFEERLREQEHFACSWN